MKKIYFESLGCPKSRIETEMAMGLLGSKGYIIINTPENSDIIFLTTCSFITGAKNETIERYKKLKKYRKKIIFFGCFVDEKRKILFNDKNTIFIGTSSLNKIPEIIGKKQKISTGRKNYIHNLPRFISTYPYSYLKISEGCSNKCTYCIIPYIRGPYRERNINDILNEAEQIISMGIKELIIVSQDTARHSKLNIILSELNRIKKKFWIRLMYLHPAHIKDNLINLVKNNEKILPYLEIPVQHISDKILKKMNRSISSYKIYKLIEKIRKKIPEIALRTTIITGFPEETEEDFKKIKKFLKEIEFDYVGVFKYSPQEKSKAYSFKNQIPEKIKELREKELIYIQSRIMDKKLKKRIGKKTEILSETKTSGRAWFQAPEIDGIVRFSKPKIPGRFYTLKIKEVNRYNLKI